MFLEVSPLWHPSTLAEKGVAQSRGNITPIPLRVGVLLDVSFSGWFDSGDSRPNSEGLFLR